MLLVNLVNPINLDNSKNNLHAFVSYQATTAMARSIEQCDHHVTCVLIGFTVESIVFSDTIVQYLL